MNEIFIRLAAMTALDDLPHNVRQTLLEKIYQLAADPRSMTNNVKMLKGRRGDMRLRFGDWRIIYRIVEDVVHIVELGPRGAIYDD
jgi:mRNA interferase RelE/StbE